MPVAENHHRDWKRALLGPAILFLVVAGFYWKLTFSTQYTWLESPDFANQVLPWYQFQAGEWHHGRLPLWDPYEWAGQPLVGQAQPGAAYPPNWVLFSLPLNHGWIRQKYLHWYFVLIHYMAALFCYLLCRDLGRSRPASLLAALGFSLGGWLGGTEWPQMLNGAIWTPLIFLFLLRTFRRWYMVPSAALAGAFLGVAFLSGHHQVPIFVLISCLAAWVYNLFIKYRLNRALLVPAAVFGVFFLAVGAMQTFPAYEYGHLALRWVGGPEPVGWNQPVPYSVHGEFGLYPLSLLGIVIQGIHKHADPYTGSVLLTLAFIGFTGAWRERAVRLIGLLAVAALLYSLASHGFLEGVLYAFVPMVEKARNPSMAIFMFHFGIAVLSAYGIDTFIDSKWHAPVRRVLTGFAVIVFGLLLAGSLTLAAKPMDYDKAAMAALSAILLAGTLYAWKAGHISPPGAWCLLGVILLVEVSEGNAAFAWHTRHDQNLLLKKLSENSDIVGYLRMQREPVRVEFDENEIPYNFGDWYGVDVLGSYLASMTENIARVQSNLRGRALLAANYYIGRKPSRAGQVEVFTGANGLKLYRNPDAFPHVWSVHRTVRISRLDESGAQFQKPALELRRAAFLLGEQPRLETCAGPDEVRLVERGTNRVVIDADLRCRGMVIASEVCYPGWKASVDGKPAAIYEPYGVLRGVVADAGRHRIEMRYRPASVFWGAALTGVGLLASALLLIALPLARRNGPVL